MSKELENSLKLSEEEQEANHNAIQLLDKFNIKNINLNYICKQFNYGNYSILPDTIANGKVFKIPIRGSLDIDGYEEGLLYLTAGSSIKKNTI